MKKNFISLQILNKISILFSKKHKTLIINILINKINNQ